MAGGYAYVWEYRVRPDAVEAFLEHYCADGHWAALFRRGNGYLGTELLRDRADATRYVTVDRWVSRAAFDRFRAAFAAEFEAIDRRCEAFTEAERELGTFTVVGDRA